MFADDPEAAQFCEKLFFDPRFSANKSLSCATCHDPALLVSVSFSV
ncbi:MAG: cytochrome c peroxidase [Ardenticatenaceae bacterium]